MWPISMMLNQLVNEGSGLNFVPFAQGIIRTRTDEQDSILEEGTMHMWSVQSDYTKLVVNDYG